METFSIMLRTKITGLLILFSFVLYAQDFKIEGILTDWEENSIVYEDLNDAQNGVDIRNLRLSHSEDFFFIAFEVSEEMIIQFESDFQVIIDADNNESTGFPINGMGSEFSFYFDDNNGFVNTSNNTINIRHDDVGFYVAPAYTSTSFEIAINRSLGDYGVELDGIISLAIINDIFSGDILPAVNSAIEYDFNEGIERSIPEASIQKPEDIDFRVLSYNVLQDQIFIPGLADEYERIFQAVQPDIIAFQEIYDHGSLQARNLVEEFLPSESGENWYHEKIGADIIVVSRYPILFDDWVDGNGVFVLDVEGRELVLFNVHFPCCGNDNEREEEIDALLSYMRDLQNGVGEYDIEDETPFMIVGDYNLVGRGSQIESLLTGNIKNNPAYGPDFNPDWGNGPMIDVTPITTNTNLTYTWYNAFGSFTGGRLDFALYTPTSLNLNNSYVLDARQMSQGQLFLSNLSETDTDDASDHLPVISDWTFGMQTAPLSAEIEVKDIDCYNENNGEILITPIGGLSPYTFQLDNGDISNVGHFTNLIPKTYLVKIFDSSGKSFESFKAVNENSEIEITINQNDDSVSINIEGGVPPYLCSIDGGLNFSDTKEFENLADGNYQLIVSDALGCTVEDSFMIITNSADDINLETIMFYPNPVNSEIQFRHVEQIASVTIFDLQGKEISKIVNTGKSNFNFDTTTLNSGHYLLKIILVNGTVSAHNLIKI